MSVSVYVFWDIVRGSRIVRFSRCGDWEEMYVSTVSDGVSVCVLGHSQRKLPGSFLSLWRLGREKCIDTVSVCVSVCVLGHSQRKLPGSFQSFWRLGKEKCIDTVSVCVSVCVLGHSLGKGEVYIYIYV